MVLSRPHPSRHSRWHALLVVALCLAAWGGTVAPVRAQLSQEGRLDRVQTGQRINLFVEWEGRTALDGVIVEVPRSWKVRQAHFVRNGRTEIPLSVSPTGPGTYAAALPARERERGVFVVQVDVEGLPGPVEGIVTPYVVERTRGGEMRRRRRDGFRTAYRLRQLPATSPGDNYALTFDGDAGPMVLRRAEVPDLNKETGHTVEFWMRTVGTDEVVLSTWTGNEQAAYPLEFVVGPAGRLLYYCGQPGLHTAMQTAQPVADGRWHHVAVTHDAEAGWTRLLMNGTAVDSLFRSVPSTPSWRGTLALGGRVPGQEGSASGTAYSGWLDEVRLWSSVRTPSAIQRSMRRSLDPRPGALILGFDDALPGSLFTERGNRAARVRSDLTFHEPIRNLRAAPEASGVVVTWRASDSQTETFVVERSTDGARFEPVGRVAGSSGQPVSNGELTYRYRDDAIDGQVVYYRVRRTFASGAERLSGAIKLGLGVEQADVMLMGNYPNPFTRTTSISYEVHDAQHVHLSVWDLSGQRVTTLVNRTQQPGYYEVSFAPGDLPSGTYFVRLRTSTGIQSHKMTLAK